MPSDDYTPRFVFEITAEQKKRVDKFLGIHGVKKALFGPILDDVLDMIEEYGGVAIGILMSGKVKPREIIPTMRKAEEVKDGTHGS